MNTVKTVNSFFKNAILSDVSVLKEKIVLSDADVKQSATVSKPAAPVSYEPDDETESPSVSKGYGINIWQK